MTFSSFTPNQHISHINYMLISNLSGTKNRSDVWRNCHNLVFWFKARNIIKLNPIRSLKRINKLTTIDEIYTVDPMRALVPDPKTSTKQYIIERYVKDSKYICNTLKLRYRKFIHHYSAREGIVEHFCDSRLR